MGRGNRRGWRVGMDGGKARGIYRREGREEGRQGGWGYIGGDGGKGGREE